MVGDPRWCLGLKLQLFPMKYLLFAVVLAAVSSMSEQQESLKSTDQQSHAEAPNKPAPNSATHSAPPTQSVGGNSEAKGYLPRLFSPENLPNVGLFVAGVAGIIVALGLPRRDGRDLHES
jgi:hypothetical protein